MGPIPLGGRGVAGPGACMYVCIYVCMYMCVYRK